MINTLGSGASLRMVRMLRIDEDNDLLPLLSNRLPFGKSDVAIGMASAPLSLGEALACGRLADFIDQCEAEGIGPAGSEAVRCINGDAHSAPTRRSNIPFTRPRFEARKVNSSR